LTAPQAGRFALVRTAATGTDFFGLLAVVFEGELVQADREFLTDDIMAGFFSPAADVELNECPLGAAADITASCLPLTTTYDEDDDDDVADNDSDTA